MKQRSIFILSILVAGALSCSPPDRPATMSAVLTEELGVWASKCCDCLQPSLEMSERMQQLVAAGRREEVIKLSHEAGRLAAEGMSCCMQRILIVGADTLPDEIVRARLNQACPDLPSILRDELILTISTPLNR